MYRNAAVVYGMIHRNSSAGLCFCKKQYVGILQQIYTWRANYKKRHCVVLFIAQIISKHPMCSGFLLYIYVWYVVDGYLETAGRIGICSRRLRFLMVVWSCQCSMCQKAYKRNTTIINQYTWTYSDDQQCFKTAINNMSSTGGAESLLIRNSPK